LTSKTTSDDSESDDFFTRLRHDDAFLLQAFGGGEEEVAVERPNEDRRSFGGADCSERKRMKMGEVFELSLFRSNDEISDDVKNVNEPLSSSSSGCAKSGPDSLYYVTTQSIEQDKFGRNLDLCAPFLGKYLAEMVFEKDLSLSKVLKNFVNSNSEDSSPTKNSVIPYQYNCWFGINNTQKQLHTSSTPLHHDYHDNLYLVVRGQKKIFLLPPTPSVYKKLNPTRSNLKESSHVNFNRENGLITYNHHMDDVTVLTDDDSDDEAVLDRAMQRVNKSQKLSQKVLPKKNKRLNDSSPPHFTELSVAEYCRRYCNYSNPDSDGQTLLINESDKLYVANLRPGDLLYMPASWFHEVHSTFEFSQKSPSQTTSSTHLAFNSWFHPPSSSSQCRQKKYYNCQKKFYEKVQLPRLEKMKGTRLSASIGRLGLQKVKKNSKLKKILSLKKKLCAKTVS